MFTRVLCAADNIRWDVHYFQNVQVCVSVSQMLTKEVRLYILSPSSDGFYRLIILHSKIYAVHLRTSFTKWVIDCVFLSNYCQILYFQNWQCSFCNSKQRLLARWKIPLIEMQSFRPQHRLSQWSQTILLNVVIFVNSMNFLKDESALTKSGRWILATLILPLRRYCISHSCFVFLYIWIIHLLSKRTELTGTHFEKWHARF